MDKKMKISIGCDHAGVDYKNAISDMLKSQGIGIINHGTDTKDSVDYPDFIHPVAEDVENGSVSFGIIICGSGNGAAMTANKHQGIRAALCWNNELASLARQHNDANIVSIPARFVNQATALSIVDTFMKASFEGGRHARRVDKIACM
jgi:ribose 5-phosphate isomerase B